MTRDAQKERELGHLRLFQRLCPDVPQTEPTPSERPDFTLAGSDGLVGIEHTQYFKPHMSNPNLRFSRPLQEQDALKDRIVARAQALHAERFGALDQADLLFRPRDIVDGRQVEELASAIADLVGSLPLNEKHERFEPTPERRFPQPLTTVFAHRRANAEPRPWRVIAAGNVRALQVSDLMGIVREKEKKQASYREGLKETWLLIVQDWWSRASYAELTAEALSAVYVSSFHRVYFLRVFHSECLRLQVTYDIAPPAA